MFYETLLSWVIKQQGESQNACFKKTNHFKFPKNEYFLPSDCTANQMTGSHMKCNTGQKWFNSFKTEAFII